VPAWRRAHAEWRRIAPLGPTVRPQAVLAIGRVPRHGLKSGCRAGDRLSAVLAIGSQRCRAGDRLLAVLAIGYCCFYPLLSYYYYYSYH